MRRLSQASDIANISGPALKVQPGVYFCSTRFPDMLNRYRLRLHPAPHATMPSRYIEPAAALHAVANRPFRRSWLYNSSTLCGRCLQSQPRGIHSGHEEAHKTACNQEGACGKITRAKQMPTACYQATRCCVLQLTTPTTATTDSLLQFTNPLPFPKGVCDRVRTS